MVLNRRSNKWQVSRAPASVSMSASPRPVHNKDVKFLRGYWVFLLSATKIVDYYVKKHYTKTNIKDNYFEKIKTNSLEIYKTFKFTKICTKDESIQQRFDSRYHYKHYNTINKCNIFNTIIIKVHNSFIVLSTYTRLQLINVIRTSPDLTL